MPLTEAPKPEIQEEYRRACARTESAEAEAQSAEIALRDERVTAHAAAAKLQEEIDKCGACVLGRKRLKSLNTATAYPSSLTLIHTQS